MSGNLVTILHVVPECVHLGTLAGLSEFLCGGPGLLETKANAANPPKDQACLKVISNILHWLK